MTKLAVYENHQSAQGGLESWEWASDGILALRARTKTLPLLKNVRFKNPDPQSGPITMSLKCHIDGNAAFAFDVPTYGHFITYFKKTEEELVFSHQLVRRVDGSVMRNYVDQDSIEQPLLAVRDSLYGTKQLPLNPIAYNHRSNLGNDVRLTVISQGTQAVTAFQYLATPTLHCEMWLEKDQGRNPRDRQTNFLIYTDNAQHISCVTFAAGALGHAYRNIDTERRIKNQLLSGNDFIL